MKFDEDGDNITVVPGNDDSTSCVKQEFNRYELFKVNLELIYIFGK